MSEIDTGAIRLRVKAKETYNITWLEETILKCADEIDRLERFYVNGKMTIDEFVDDIEHRTKEAVWEKIQESPCHTEHDCEGEKHHWYVDTSIRQAIDLAEVK